MSILTRGSIINSCSLWEGSRPSGRTLKSDNYPRTEIDAHPRERDSGQSLFRLFPTNNLFLVFADDFFHFCKKEGMGIQVAGNMLGSWLFSLMVQPSHKLFLDEEVFISIKREPDVRSLPIDGQGKKGDGEL